MKQDSGQAGRVIICGVPSTGTFAVRGPADDGIQLIVRNLEIARRIELGRGASSRSATGLGPATNIESLSDPVTRQMDVLTSFTFRTYNFDV